MRKEKRIRRAVLAAAAGMLLLLCGCALTETETPAPQSAPCAAPLSAARNRPKSTPRPTPEPTPRVFETVELDDATITEGCHSTASFDWDYWIYEPALASQGEGLPMVVYLHGSGGSGRDPRILIRRDKGLGRFLAEGTVSVDSLIFLPQSHDDWKHGLDELPALIEWAVEYYGADPERVVLIGCSAGGIAAFELLMEREDLFCCCALMGAKTSPKRASGIKLPLRLYHGKNDYHMGFSVVTAERLINENGGSCELVMMSGVWHSEQIALYQDEWGLWDWIGEQIGGLNFSLS